MGRDTSISIFDKHDYNRLEKVNEVLDYDDIDYDLLCQLEMFADELGCNSLIEEVAYWDKSECDEVVQIMRNYDYDDGDIIMTTDMVDAICHLLTSQQITKLTSAFEDDKYLAVYNTNG